MSNEEDFDRAVAILEKAHEVILRLMKSGSKLNQESVEYLNAAYVLKGDLKRAKALVKQLLEELRQTEGVESEDYLGQLGNLGEILLRGNELEQAEPLLRRVAADYARLGGRDHLGVAKNLQRLGTVLEKRKKVDEAEATFREVVQLCENRSESAASGYIAFSLRGLAEIYRDRGKNDEAEKCLRSALEASERLIRGRESRGCARLVSPRRVAARAQAD